MTVDFVNQYRIYNKVLREDKNGRQSVIIGDKTVTTKVPGFYYWACSEIAKEHINCRLKLLAKVHEQIELCSAKKDGNTYAPKRLKTFTDKVTGERKTVETVKRVKEWFWINETGKIHLAIKYGSKTIMLNKKGANAIEVTNGDELISTLKHIAGSIENGELDEFINDVSKATRDSFAK